MPKYILALDQGTTSSRAALVDERGAIVHMAQQEFPQHFPAPGWVEHDPMDILKSVDDVIGRCLAEAGVRPESIQAIGITNQRETTLLWDRADGRPIGNAIVWQSRQTQPICNELKEQGLEPLFRERTGLLLDPYFSGTKIKWLLDQDESLRGRAERGELAFGTVDSWLVWHLSGGKTHVTDVTNASRTLLFDIHRMIWDEELLRLMGIPSSIMPNLCGNAGPIAQVQGHPVLGDGIPITGMAGDQQAALFGQTCFESGMAKNTYGTGCFMLMNTGAQAVSSSHGLLTSVAWQLGGRTEYVLEGSIFVAGSAVQWLRDGLRIIDSAAESEELALRASSTDGIYVVPAFVGLGAPYWVSEARGAVFGLTRGSGREHLVRATLEAIAYQTKDVVTAMEADAGMALKTLRADGGATANRFLMQFQSDILGVPVECCAVHETTVLGAAYLAGLGSGMWSSQADLADCREAAEEYKPVIDPSTRERLYSGWQKAVHAAVAFSS